MEVQHHRSIAAIDARTWDAFTGEMAFASRNWLAFAERVLPEDEPHYLLVEEAGRLIGAAVLWLRRELIVPDLPAGFARVISAWVRRRPVLICEVPIADVSGLFLPADAANRGRVLAALAPHARALAARLKASFLIFGYLERAAAYDPAWDPDFHRVQLNPGTSMDLRGYRDYEAYRLSLNHKRRKNLRRARAAVEAQGVQVSVRTAMDPAVALPLIENVAARHGSPAPPEIARLIAHAGMVPVRWLVAEREGRVAGFDLLIGDRGVWRVKTTGSDYLVDQLYFLLSEEDIRFAIGEGARELRAGSHLYDVKRRLGYDLMDNGHVRYAGLPGWARAVAWMFRRA